MTDPVDIVPTPVTGTRPTDAPCAQRSRQRGDPVEATASRVRRWVLVEQPGPWGPDALASSRMDTGLARQLAAAAHEARARVVLVRRPRGLVVDGADAVADGGDAVAVGGGRVADGGERADVRRRVTLAHTGSRARWIEHLELDDDELARLDLSPLASPRPPGMGRTADRETVLVCTHGRHDRCCADLGRPVVRAIVADRPISQIDLWESSHIGGDRFAANVVALPTGVYLGRVPPERAPAIVRALAAGRIDPATYRGRCCHPTLVQAADIALRESLGEHGIDAWNVDDVGVVSSTISGDEAEIVLEHAGGRSLLRVRREAGPAVQLSCSGGTGTPWRYQVIEHRPA